MKKFILMGMIGLFVLSSCAGHQTKTEKASTIGVAGGAIAGAILGQAIGHHTGWTLLVSAAGAAIGAGIGLMMDRQEAEMRDALAASEALDVRREAVAVITDWIFLIRTLKTGMPG